MDVVSQNMTAGRAAAAGEPSGFRVRARTLAILRAAAAVALPAIAVCACGTSARPAALPVPSRPPSASAAPSPSPVPSPSPTRRSRARRARAAVPASSPSRPPSPAPAPPGSSAAGGCQSTFVPAYFYDSDVWAQAIDIRPAPRVLLLNVDNGVGTAPQSHFQGLVRQAQAAGITVLGYSSTVYGQRSVASVEAEVRDYKAWYGVNGIFLDLTQGTSGEFSYYRQLASYIRSTVPNAVIWLNPGDYPDPSFMSIANVVMVFEGSYASYVQTQVPGWVSNYQPGQFAHVIYATPESDFASAVRLSRSRRAGYLFVTDLPGSGNPYGAMPSYWAQEAATVEGEC